ncbi:MAG: RluA family pseudouridine synthase [Bacteroidia bacterium]
MDGWDFELKPYKKKREFVHFEELILVEDEHVIAVNKPHGISSLSDRDSEVNMLRLGRNYLPEVQLCHRLDKETTGVLLFAKNPDVYREMAILFEHREVVKHYLALVPGRQDFQEQLIDLPITVGAKGKVKIDFKGGKESATVVSTAEHFKDFTLVDCFPLTGRTHQIRIHLASVGCPLVGDELYGGKHIHLSEFKRKWKFNRKEEEPTINDGVMLHARGLQFTLYEKEYMIVAPLPKKFEAALKILRRYDA